VTAVGMGTDTLYNRCKLDVDEEEELAALFGIRSVPSLLFVPMNGTPQMAQGALPKKNLKDAIQNVLLKND
jgi:thioredoxin-like negative regulator of GroEL